MVTNKKDIPHAILIRAVDPIKGIEKMLERTGKKDLDYTLTKGPGNVTKALGISTKHNGYSLCTDGIYIMDDGFKIAQNNIQATARIGVDYAGEDAKRLYRFIVNDNPYVSGKK